MTKPSGIPVSLVELSEKIHLDRKSNPVDYAPPPFREDPAILHVKTFGELPTKELDEIMNAVEAEIEALKKEAQAVRDMYMKHTTRITSSIQRLQEGVKLSMETMGSLRAQCLKLDNGDTPEV